MTRNGGGGAIEPPTSTELTTAPPAIANNAKPNPWYPDHAVFNTTKDELQKMPEFKYSTE